METIQNVANTASKIIWGEGAATQNNETAGKEPIAGETGKGTATEPYDQGNSEDPTTTSNKPSTATTETPSTNPTSTMSDTTSAPINPVNASTGGHPDPLKDTDKTGVVSDATKPSDTIPSERSENPGVAPSSGAAPEIKHQGADAPSDEPKGPKDDAEDFMKTRDPNDHSGEPMKMHDGSDKKIPATQEERRESKVGMPGGQEHGKDPKGTGEEWVKTSGLGADGGDFDATKPGAGREANRLLEEKGIKKNDGNSGPPEDISGGTASGASPERKEKVPLKEKLKEKLHLGHKDK